MADNLETPYEMLHNFLSMQLDRKMSLDLRTMKIENGKVIGVQSIRARYLPIAGLLEVDRLPFLVPIDYDFVTKTLPRLFNHLLEQDPNSSLLLDKYGDSTITYATVLADFHKKAKKDFPTIFRDLVI